MRDTRNYLPQDTADSSADFLLVATSGASLPGLPSPLTPCLGAPSPAGLTAPALASDFISVSLLDPGQLQSVPPNRVRTGSGNSGTILVRRTIFNRSGRAFTKLRLHVTLITSLNSPLIPGATLASQADVRLMSSFDEAQVATSRGDLAVSGLRLEAPSVAAQGALGSTLSCDAVLSSPLQPNESRSISFLLTVIKSGTYQIILNVESLSAPLMVPSFHDSLLQ